MKKVRNRLAAAMGLLTIVVVAAEITARIEDRLRLDVPLLATPDRERDLVQHDAIAIRGKPDGRFKQWRLNEFGFRNQEMTETPQDGCTRIMALGASETFGLYESPGMEYPAQLDTILDRTGNCHEVVNAAIVGLPLPGIIRLWDGWGSRFRSHVVLIYPTPAFYLGERPPQTPGRPPATPRVDTPWWTPRILERAQDRIEYPDVVQRYRVRRTLDAAAETRPTDWFFRSIPTDRVAQFRGDLERLVEQVRSHGAYPLLLTHATAFHNPAQPEELPVLDAWRALQPKPTTQVLLDFEEASRRATLSVADSNGVAVIDLASHMGGHREWFAEDFIHFSERGAGVVAELIAQHLGSAPISRMQVVHAVQ